MKSKTFRTTVVREGSVCFVPRTFDPKAVFGKVRACLGEAPMKRVAVVTVHLVAAVLTLLQPSRALGAELAPDVLAQVNQSGGHGGPGARGVRIFIDGRIEALESDAWNEIGRLSPAAVLRLKSVTDVMTPTSRLATKDTNLADAGLIEYSVRNGAGQIVLIGRAGAQEAALLQGGASSLIRVLEGLQALAWISF